MFASDPEPARGSAGIAELRSAARSFRTGRISIVTALIVLTGTMAAATITFSVVDHVAIRPLPFGNPDRLVSISRMGASPNSVSLASPFDYVTWLEGTRAFESLAAARLENAAALKAGGATEDVVVRSISPNLFDVLRVRPEVGGFFRPEHAQPGGNAVVILSHDLWTRRFGADPAVVGRYIDIGAQKRQVVGVAPAGVWFPIGTGPSPDLYVPYVVTDADRANNRGYSIAIVARLKRGVSVEGALADVKRVSTVGVVVRRLHDHVVGSASRTLLLTLTVTGLVLLVASVNVASLMVARATMRSAEFATRLALGSSPRRLAMSLVMEGLMLSTVAAAAATIISYWGVQIVTSGLPADLPRASTISIDGRILTATILVALACGALFGGAPAWFTLRTNLFGMIRDGATGTGGRRYRLLYTFLALDIAFVSVLLVAAGLIITTFIHISRVDLGFTHDNLMTVSYQRMLTDVPQSNRQATVTSLRNELLARARSVPGVANAAVSLGGAAPLSGSSVRYSLIIPGVGETPKDDWLETNMVSPEYFDVLGMHLRRGRLFGASDGLGAPAVMVINDAAARRFFPERDPVGQVVTFRVPTTIVGIVQGVRFEGPESNARPAMYLPIDQQPSRAPITFGILFVRTNTDARAIAESVRQALNGPLRGEASQPKLINDFWRGMTSSRRFNAHSMAIFGLIAVGIAAIGIYGTMAFLVAQRVREIGIRIALGASRERVILTVSLDALKVVGVGILLGLVTARLAVTVMESLIFGVRSTDPSIYLGAAVFLGIVAFLATLQPALRAAKVDPLQLMKHT